MNDNLKNRDPDPGAQKAPKNISGAASEQSSIGVRRLLLVEDNQVTAWAYKQMLEKEGFSVVHISDGLDAFKAIQDQQFDLVLLDLMLPEIDGIEILKRTHERNADFKTPVVVLTEADLELVRAQVRQYGVNQFFTKTGADAMKVVEAIKALTKPARTDKSGNASQLKAKARGEDLRPAPPVILQLHLADTQPIQVRKISDMTGGSIELHPDQKNLRRGGRSLLRKILFLW